MSTENNTTPFNFDHFKEEAMEGIPRQEDDWNWCRIRASFKASAGINERRRARAPFTREQGFRRE